MSNIMDMFGTQTEQADAKIMGIVDVSHLFHRVIHGCRGDLQEHQWKDFGLARHIFLNSIIKAKAKLDIDEMVLAMDRAPYWREDHYDLYKYGRKDAKRADGIDWGACYDFLNQTIEGIEEFFPWKVVGCQSAEADDVIACLARRFGADREVIIVGSDKDFHQLLQYEGVSQYDPMQEKWIEPTMDPKEELQLKVICGDGGDGIGNVLMDNALTKQWLDGEVKKPACGVVKARKMIAEGTLESDPGIKKNYERNKQLIDLSQVPLDLFKQIIKMYREANSPPKNAAALLTWMHAHKLRKLGEQINAI